VAPGSYGYYRLHIENNGPATANNVVITDTLPAGFAFDYGATMCTKIASRPPHDVIRCKLAYITPGSPVELVLYGTIDNDVCGRMVNLAAVSSDTPDSHPYNNHTSLTFIVAPCDQPGLVIYKHLVTPSSGIAAPGDIVTFAIDIYNIGDRPLIPVPLRDVFDSNHLSYVSASPQPDQFMAIPGQGILRWTDLTGAAPYGFGHALAPGAHFTVFVHLRTKKVGWGENCAEATIAAYELNDKSCDGVEIIHPDAELVIDKTLITPASGIATIGQIVEFKISLNNTGNAPITSLHLQDIYDPAFLSFQSSDLAPDDSIDDGQLDWSNIISQIVHPIPPGTTVSFRIRFRAKQTLPPGLFTQNCIWAGFQHEQGSIIETPQRCARLSIKDEEEPSIVIRKILYDPPGGVAAPGDIVKFSFVITNTGATTLTNIALTDLYNTACLHFVPTGWPPALHLDPDDLTDDGQLDWSNYITTWGGSMPPGGMQQVWPGVKFIAQAGPNCEPTINHLQAVATDAGGQHATAQDDAPVSIRESEEPHSDFGDAPCEINHAGVGMTAYPAGGPAGVGANFPTVYDPQIGALGPIHHLAQAGAWLGEAVTAERNADLPPDADGPTNIDPPADAPDRDGADDGLQLPLALPNCQPTTFTFQVTFPPGGPQIDYFLNAWFDWNRNGQWGEELDCGKAMAKEWAVQNMPIPYHTPGTYSFTTPVFLPWQPDSDGPQWLRLTLSEQRSSHPDASGPVDGYEFGETEDYYLSTEPPYRWRLYLPLILRKHPAKSAWNAIDWAKWH